MYENNVFDLREKNSYPRILNDKIKLLSFNSNDSTLIGSASYKIQKYPADIDLYEQVKKCCSKDDAIEYFYLGIKNIVNNINQKQYHWVMEVKCGIDDRFDIEITVPSLTAFLEEYKYVISNSDYVILSYLIQDFDDISQEKAEDIIRKYKIIRWSGDDVMLGWVVKQGEKFYFKDCVDTHSPINLEVIAIVNNKFTDMSNFFVLIFHNKIDDQDYVINFPQDYLTNGKEFVIEGLKAGINKVLFSNLNRDVFKGIKRMFSLARLTQDMKLFNKIKPIISSDLSALSQIKSELATIHEILEFTDGIPWNIVYSQLEDLNWKVGGNLFLSQEEANYVSDIIHSILQNRNDVTFMKKGILESKNFLLRIINEEAMKYLKSINLYKYF